MASLYNKIKIKLVSLLSETIKKDTLRIFKEEIESVKMISAKSLLLSHSQRKEIQNLKEAEFKVFSQWGDDGIIQYLINNIEISSEKFIEFGVENYLESNTRFLLKNNNWEGLVIDGSPENIDYIKSDSIYWKHTLTAIEAFVTKENINQIIKNAGYQGNIGLLHIDIDGNDYWIWEAIDCIKPDIVIVEYNSILGKERAITIPYDKEFVRSKAHYSNLYAGASLYALYQLGVQKGYSFVGCNSAGNNAYFVKNEKSNNINVVSLDEGYVVSKFREARGEDGKLLYLTTKESLSLISGLPVYNVLTNQLELI